MDTFICWANRGMPPNLDERKFGACTAFRGDCCRLEKGDKIHLTKNYKNGGDTLGVATVKKVLYNIGFSPNETKSEIQQLAYIKID